MRQKKSAPVSTLTVETTGLPTGSYGIDATNKDATTAHLGDFAIEAVTPVADDPATPEDESAQTSSEPDKVTLVLAATVDALNIASLSISDATPTVLLTGDISGTQGTTRFFANVPVTNPPSVATEPTHGSGPKTHAKRVHGHTVLQSTSTDGVETQRHVLWVAFGAPAAAELTINVDGVVVGTVTSSGQGKVMFKTLAPDVVIPSIKLITLTDAAGAVVMQAIVQP